MGYKLAIRDHRRGLVLSRAANRRPLAYPHVLGVAARLRAAGIRQSWRASTRGLTGMVAGGGARALCAEEDVIVSTFEEGEGGRGLG